MEEKKYSPAERDAAVLAVLKEATQPLGPSEIGRRIGQPWCCYGSWGASAPVTPVLRRVGAIRHRGGKYTAPEAA